MHRQFEIVAFRPNVKTASTCLRITRYIRTKKSRNVKGKKKKKKEKYEWKSVSTIFLLCFYMLEQEGNFDARMEIRALFHSKLKRILLNLIHLWKASLSFSPSVFAE